MVIEPEDPQEMTPEESAMYWRMQGAYAHADRLYYEAERLGDSLRTVVVLVVWIGGIFGLVASGLDITGIAFMAGAFACFGVGWWLGSWLGKVRVPRWNGSR